MEVRVGSRWAARQGHDEMVEVLLEAKAALAKQTGASSSALQTTAASPLIAAASRG